jgi:hypothetical protein
METGKEMLATYFDVFLDGNEEYTEINSYAS